jgi:4-hydroxybenzoate polyprenyltransferase
MKYLKLIRYQNLLLLAFMQLLFRYGFLKFQNNIVLSLSDWQYGLLVLATILIAAAGYIINDIFDQETDYDNKKENAIASQIISEKSAYNLYFALNIIGVCIGYYLANVIQKPSFAGVFIIISATLYMYATTLKQMIIIGNIIVALLLSFSVVIIGLFDLLPSTYIENQAEMGLLFSILIDYAIFTFIINFIRELIKDMEDIEGDKNNGMNTLPIALGNARTAKVASLLTSGALLLLLAYIYKNMVITKLYYSVVYAFVFIVAPLIFVAVKAWQAKEKAQFSFISKVLKWIIFFGILSILMINLNIKYNVK